LVNQAVSNYQNPTADKIMIEINSFHPEEGMRLELRNITGSKVWHFESAGNTIELSLNYLATGSI